jgi:hypothetical protein
MRKLWMRTSAFTRKALTGARRAFRKKDRVVEQPHATDEELPEDREELADAPLISHLIELRQRILKALLSILCESAYRRGRR